MIITNFLSSFFIRRPCTVVHVCVSVCLCVCMVCAVKIIFNYSFDSL